MSLKTTPLEFELLSLFHEIHGHVGFPDTADISVTSRENTGAGRYVQLSSNVRIPMPDGFYDMGGRFIEIAGVANGLMAVVQVAKGVPVQMEIAVYGGDSWDGSEQTWTFK